MLAVDAAAAAATDVLVDAPAATTEERVDWVILVALVCRNSGSLVAVTGTGDAYE